MNSIKFFSFRMLGLLLVLGGSLPAQTYAMNSHWKDSYALEQKGEYGDAARVIEDFATRSTLRQFTLLRTAWLYYLDGDYSHSIKNYKKALESNQYSIDAQVGMLAPMAAQFRWAEITLVAGNILEISPWNYQAHLYLMQSRNNDRSWNALKIQAKALIKRFPTTVDPWIFLARAYHNEHNTKGAVAAYRHVLLRFPTNIEASLYIASATQ